MLAVEVSVVVGDVRAVEAQAVVTGVQQRLELHKWQVVAVEV